MLQLDNIVELFSLIVKLDMLSSFIHSFIHPSFYSSFHSSRQDYSEQLYIILESGLVLNKEVITTSLELDQLNYLFDSPINTCTSSTQD